MIAAILVIAITAIIIVYVVCHRKKQQARTPQKIASLHQPKRPSSEPQYLAPDPTTTTRADPDVIQAKRDPNKDRPPIPIPVGYDNTFHVVTVDNALADSNPSIVTHHVPATGPKSGSVPINGHLPNNQYTNLENNVPRISDVSSSQNSTVRGGVMQAANFENIY